MIIGNDDFKHVTKDGKQMDIRDMSDDHLLNMIKLIKRKAKEGVVLAFGGGSSPDDFYYEEEQYLGRDVKEMMRYKKYKKEAKRRGLKT